MAHWRKSSIVYGSPRPTFKNWTQSTWSGIARLKPNKRRRKRANSWCLIISRSERWRTKVSVLFVFGFKMNNHAAECSLLKGFFIDRSYRFVIRSSINTFDKYRTNCLIDWYRTMIMCSMFRGRGETSHTYRSIRVVQWELWKCTRYDGREQYASWTAPPANTVRQI